MLFVLFLPFVSRGFFLDFNVVRFSKNHLRFRTICYHRCSLFPFRLIIIILKIVSSNIGDQSNNDSQQTRDNGTIVCDYDNDHLNPTQKL